MARKAVIGTGAKVENVIEAGDGFTIPGKMIIAALNAQIGDVWTGSEFITPPAPPEPVPESVTPRQARLMLLQAGLLDTVETAIANGPRADQITWEFAVDVKRDYPMIANLAAVLNLSSAQIDEMFRQAAKL